MASSDITVGLELDDSKYSSKLKQAQASAKQFTDTISHTGNAGNQAFTKMSDAVDGLNVRFRSFTTLLVGAGIAQFVSSVISSADALVDMADGLGVNAARLQEMGMAATGAGSNMEKLTAGIGRMEVNIQAAVDGSASMQKAFSTVGVSIDDINSKTPDQLFNQIAIAISKIEDPSKRAALTTDLFGKSMRGIDFKAYVSNIVSVYGSMDQFAESQRKAAELSDKMAMQMSLVKTSFLDLLSPILNIVTPTNDAGAAMDRARIAAWGLATAFGLFVGVKIVSSIQAIGTAWKTVAGWLGLSTVATVAETGAMAKNSQSTTVNATAKTALTGVQIRLAAATAAASLAQKEYNLAILGAGPASAAAIAASQALAVVRAEQAAATAAATAATVANTTATVASTGASAGLLASIGALVARLGGLATVAAVASGALAMLWSNNLNEGEDAEVERMHKLESAIRRLSKAEKERYDKLTPNERQIANEQMLSLEAMKQQQDIMNKITGANQPVTGNNTFGETPDDKAAREKLEAKTKSERESLDALQRSYSQLNATKENGLRDSMKLLEMDQRSATIQKAINDATQEYISKRDDLQQKIDNYTYGSKEEQAQVESLKIGLKYLTNEYDAHKKSIGELTGKLYDLQQARMLDKFATEEQVKLETELKNITDQYNKTSLSEIEKKYYDIESAAKASAAAKIKSIEADRNAVMSDEEQKKYYDAALKGTERLKEANAKLYEQSRSFETGWKNAFNSYVDDATNAARQAERIFQKVTSGMEDMIVGFAKTGKFEWKSFVNSMVEELLRSQVRTLMAQIFNIGGTGSAGKGGLFGGALIPGILASGGPVSGNRPYVVGEQGPELFLPSGNGQMVPNRDLQGTTNVTYNISAVDAMSFKQLVASDPGFIYAVTQQGAKGIPSTRR